MQIATQDFTNDKVAEALDERSSAPEVKAPKGFDILMQDAISQFNLDGEQIKKLQHMTANREIANAQLGYYVYYRRATIERLFGDGK